MTDQSASAEQITARAKRHLQEFARLAAPVIASRTGLLLLATVDTAMLGRVAPTEVAQYTLGTSPFIVLMVAGIGLMFGTMIATSHAYGADDPTAAGRAWRQALPYALLVGSILFTLSQLGDHYFALTKPAAELMDGSSRVFALQGIGLIPVMLFVCCSFFLEGINRPFPVLGVIITANLVNFTLNGLVLNGVLGDALVGADGVALATALTRAAMALTLLGYVWWLRDRDRFRLRDPLQPGWWRDSRQQRRYGYAAGLSFGFETVSFAAMAIYAGWLGTDAAAVYGVVMNILAVMFMGALGLATATSIRVGIAHGRRDWLDRAVAGWTGFFSAMAVISLFAVTLWTFPADILGIYLKDDRLVRYALPGAAMIGIVIYADGGQVVMAQALRGAADTWMPTAMNFVSYIMIMVPAGYVLTQVIENDVFGLFQAVLIGSLVSICVLGSRWTWLSLRKCL